jgi:hypothetical protein
MDDDCEDYESFPMSAAEKRYYDRLGDVYEYCHSQQMSTEAACVELGYCASVVEMRDSEGYPTTGRCLDDATQHGMCEGHVSEMLGWLNMSESERAHWEREHDKENP